MIAPGIEVETEYVTNIARQVAGGYFVWITLPEGIDASDLAHRAQTDENLISGRICFQEMGFYAVGSSEIFRLQLWDRHDYLRGCGKGSSRGQL